MYGRSITVGASLSPFVLSPNLRLLLSVAFMLSIFVTLGQSPASAQAVSGTLVGNVTDPTGGAIAGAGVKVTQTQTNEVRTSTTNNTGE
jgi:hypothetical protein